MRNDTRWYIYSFTNKIKFLNVLNFSLRYPDEPNILRHDVEQNCVVVKLSNASINFWDAPCTDNTSFKFICEVN